MVFNFLPLHAPWTKAAWQDMIERVERELPAGAWPTWVLSNHDVAAFAPGWAGRRRPERRPSC